MIAKTNLSLFIAGIIVLWLFPGSSTADPNLQAKFKVEAWCNDEPGETQTGVKELNWQALDCVFGLLGKTTGFARAHIIAGANSESVDLNWLTHVRGGFHEAKTPASANLKLDGEFALEEVDPQNRELTFLWIKDRQITFQASDKDNQVKTGIDFELNGAYYGSFDKLTSFEGKTLKGILGATSAFKFKFSLRQHHEHQGACCHKTMDGQIQFPYRIISPETCLHRSHFWNPGYFDKGAIQRLVNIVCVSIGKSPGNPEIGKHTYSIVNNLEKFADRPKTYPMSSQVAKIRLKQFWNEANITFGSARKASAKSLREAEHFFLDMDDPDSLPGLLELARKDFGNGEQRMKIIRHAFTDLTEISSSLSSLNRKSKVPAGIGTIMEALKEPRLTTLNEIDELALASFAVGKQLKDQADLDDLEAEVYALKSGQGVHP